MSRYFITATGTDIGKTLVTTTLCYQLTQSGKKVTALKPVASGFNANDPESDSVLILQSRGLPADPALIDTISPWRFSAPLSPPLAAAREGRAITMKDVVVFCRTHESLSGITLIEGAGGVMSPLDNTHTMLDWMQTLHWPVILVTGSYLGSISHTLTALEALRARGVPLQALVISESERSAVSLEESADAVAPYIGLEIPVVKLPRLSVDKNKFKHAPLISWICQ